MKIIVERIAVKEMIKFIADRKLSKAIHFLFLLHLGSLSFFFLFSCISVVWKMIQN